MTRPPSIGEWVERTTTLSPHRLRQMQLENQSFLIDPYARAIYEHLVAGTKPAEGTLLRAMYDAHVSLPRASDGAAA